MFLEPKFSANVNPFFALIICLFFLLTWPFSTVLAVDCRVDASYDPRSEFAPDFMLRSGYSRDNDDAAEGSYETAVMDLMLIGRFQPTNSKTCLALLVNFSLSAHISSAPSYVSQFSVRNAGIVSDVDGTWTKVFEASKRGSALTVMTHAPKDAPYLLEHKYKGPYQGPSVQTAATLKTVVPLGEVSNGAYVGRVYFQRPTSGQGPKASFESTDINSYVQVRHILEWRLNHKDGVLINPMDTFVSDQPTANVFHFTNHLRLILPPWSGQIVRVESGRSEQKVHSVKLMWKDYVYKGQSSDKIRYLKVSQLDHQENDPRNDESIGRLPKALIKTQTRR